MSKEELVYLLRQNLKIKLDKSFGMLYVKIYFDNNIICQNSISLK